MASLAASTAAASLGVSELRGNPLNFAGGSRMAPSASSPATFKTVALFQKKKAAPNAKPAAVTAESDELAKWHGFPPNNPRPPFRRHIRPQKCSRLKTKRRHQLVVCSVLHESATIADAAIGYSTASYYTSLGLFVISVPGLWSLIKRSVKSKVVQKTFVEEQGKKKGPNQVAGEILSFFTRNNFVVLDKGETITFEGMMVPSRGQAALLTFCTCISLASVALVLTITLPDVGNYWFALTLLSPLAGVYYWKRASRKEQIKVKMILAEDGKLSEIIVQGDDQQVDQMRRELQLTEKGMVYVKGIFER